MPVADWGNLNYLSGEECDAFVLAQDAGVGHGHVLCHGEEAAGEFGSGRRQGSGGSYGEALVVAVKALVWLSCVTLPCSIRPPSTE